MRLVLKEYDGVHGSLLVEITLVPLAAATRIELVIRFADGRSYDAASTGWGYRLKQLFPPSGRGTAR